MSRTYRRATLLTATAALGGCVFATPVVAAAAPLAGTGHRQQTSPQASQKAVYPRVSGGGFNGQAQWQGLFGGWGAYAEAWGQAWSYKGTTYVYLAWTSGGEGVNKLIGSVPQGKSEGVPVHKYDTGYSPGSIAVTVCSDYPSWHCGTPYRV
jgi:hypothetical protein